MHKSERFRCHSVQRRQLYFAPFFLPALAENGKVRERFLREAEITGKLEQPGIVPVYGLGRDADGRRQDAMSVAN